MAPCGPLPAEFEVGGKKLIETRGFHPSHALAMPPTSKLLFFESMYTLSICRRVTLLVIIPILS